MSYDCYTCFLYYSYEIGKLKVLCVSGKVEEIVRTYMHPTDPIGETLRIFGAQMKCFDRYDKKEVKKVIKDVSGKYYSECYSDIMFEKV